MSWAERRERLKQETRALILEAGRELMAEHGVEAVTMRRIAERIEVTPTAVYFHFADREALLRELLDQVPRVSFDLDANSDGFELETEADDEADEEHSGIQPIDVARRKRDEQTESVRKLRRACEAYVKFGLRHPHAYRRMFMIKTAPDATEQRAYEALWRAVQRVASDGLLNPSAEDAEHACQVLWSVLHGVVALELTARAQPWIAWAPLERRVSAAIDAALHWLIAER